MNVVKHSKIKTRPDNLIKKRLDLYSYYVVYLGIRNER